MKQFGLIGFPLGHSYSKRHFTNKFESEGLLGYSYHNFEIASVSCLKELILNNPDLQGLNVTIPHKQAVIPFLDEIDTIALEVGAVNTIKITRLVDQFTLKGFNTDVIGFVESLKKWNFDQPVKALVFGSGGSSLAVKYALKLLNIEFLAVSRRSSEGYISYDNITSDLALNHSLWINCTPVGMFPGVDGQLPLPYSCLTDSHYLFDLIYNPAVSGFLRMGVNAGAQTMNGSVMLYEQAEASWRIWQEKL